MADEAIGRRGLLAVIGAAAAGPAVVREEGRYCVAPRTLEGIARIRALVPPRTEG
ncbi:hypothetical protein [Variovorax sp. 38R]|uniref:hypothetical protein n=1 Tax=Variovorax sp. 38R TaxID=2774875 RepID=UPI0017858904|nr:hypothetical protein [Variovorax sp. 38R]QOF77447.1 hypothetical protein IG196_24320 [Variovorax sp. 38R]